MDRPTRKDQARAILERRGARLASRILGRRATSAADFAEAFNVEYVDLISEIPSPDALLALGRNLVGPRDGLYVLEESDGYRIYLQERGIAFDEVRGATFDEARDAVIDRLIRLGGLPWSPPGRPLC